MQQRENGTILKELTQSKKKIDKQKAELRKELAKLEAEKAATESGKKPGGEAFTISAIFSNHTPEEIERRIKGIEAALALPYYADSEYRRLSIEYMEAVTTAEAEELAKNETEIETTKRAAEEAEERLEHLKKAREDIRAAAADKIANVGLADVSNDCMDYSPAYILKKYKELCERYNA